MGLPFLNVGPVPDLRGPAAVGSLCCAAPFATTAVVLAGFWLVRVLRTRPDGPASPVFRWSMGLFAAAAAVAATLLCALANSVWHFDR
jgi:hypothetical protein